MTRRDTHSKTLILILLMALALIFAQSAKAQPAQPMAAAPVAAMTAPATVPPPAMAVTAPAAPVMDVAPVQPMAVAPPVAPPTTMAAVPTVTTMAAAPVQPPEKKTETTGEKKDSWWQTLTGGILQILLIFFGAIATALGPFLIKWIANKAKISNQETIKAMEDLYDKAIALGVQFATQQSNKLNNNPDAKSQRIKWATDMAVKFITEWKLPEKSAAWIADRIEAKLGEGGKKESKPEEKPVEETKPEEPKPEEKPPEGNG